MMKFINATVQFWIELIGTLIFGPDCFMVNGLSTTGCICARLTEIRPK